MLERSAEIRDDHRYIACYSRNVILISSKCRRKKLSHVGERVEINVLDSSDIHAAMKELRQIQKYLEEQFSK